MTRSNLIKYFKFFLSIFISLAVLYVIFSRFDLSEVFFAIKNVNIFWLVIALFFLFSIHPLFALRWRIGMNILGYEESFPDVFKVYLANLPLSKISPSYSGDFVRAFYFRKNIPIGKGTGLILFEALVDIFFLGLAALMGGFLLNFELSKLVGGSIVFFVLFFVLAIPYIIDYLPKRFRSKLKNFTEIFRCIKNSTKIFAFLFLSLLMIFILILYIRFSFLAFGADVSFIDVAANYPLVNLISLIPLTVWGVGVRESSMVYLFRGVAEAQCSFSVALLYSFIGVVILPLIAMPFFLRLFNNSDYFKIKEYEQ